MGRLSNEQMAESAPLRAITIDKTSGHAYHGVAPRNPRPSDIIIPGGGAGRIEMIRKIGCFPGALHSEGVSLYVERM